VAQGDEVDEVIRMQMTDDDRIESPRVEDAGEPGERPLAEIEHQARTIVAQEVRGADGPGSVGIRGAGAYDIEPHRSYW
jgi:hypothetical protein